MDKKQAVSSASDFLSNDNFVSWRLLRTEELDNYWTNFLKENPNRKPMIDEACRKFEAVRLNDINPTSEMEEELYRRIYNRINAHKQRKISPGTYWLSSAACFILIASIVFFINRNVGQRKSLQNEIVGITLPDKRVQLIAGSEVIDLESYASISISGNGETSVTDSTQHTTLLTLASHNRNKLIVPYGKRLFITLPDGTKVWLNSGTELEFPSNFTKASRNIWVKGEIYIEVAKSNLPFFVHTEQATVRVLGTKFSINAYKDNNKELIVLVEGSVQVLKENQNSITLLPNEMATVSVDEIERTNVDASEYNSWHSGMMVFNKTPLNEVLRKIERYYNVSFESNHNMALNKKTVSGKLILSKNLDSVMASVSILSSIDYRIINNHISNFHKK